MTDMRHLGLAAAALVLGGLLGAAPAAAQPASVPATEHGGDHSPAGHELHVGAVLFEQLEWGVGLGDTPSIARWDGQAWYGTDTDRVWFRTEGELNRRGRAERAEFQLLYSRLLSYYWDVQAGLRYDLRPRPDRTYGVIGIQGLAPGFFEVNLQGFVSERGDVSARFEVSYDLYITQRLVLQPNIETNIAIQRVPELGIGSGINDVEVGLRLRYEFTREIAPYIGISYERRFGDTARYARRDGENVEAWNFLTGIRLFF